MSDQSLKVLLNGTLGLGDKQAAYAKGKENSPTQYNQLATHIRGGISEYNSANQLPLTSELNSNRIVNQGILKAEPVKTNEDSKTKLLGDFNYVNKPPII